MNLPLALLAAAATAAADAGGGSPARWAGVRRRASYETIAGYLPSSAVTDQCAIDRDVAAMEAQLALRTEASFGNARRIYNMGGNSESYARVELVGDDGLAKPLPKGTIITGESEGGARVLGRAYESYERGDKVIEIRYETRNKQANYVGCQVGGLVETNTEECFKGEGDLDFNGKKYAYNYDPALDNRNGRTIAGFSEGVKDRDIIHTKDDFKYFFNYYGTDDYAHCFIEAAFAGQSTQFMKENGNGGSAFKNGNADFSRYDLLGREQFIRRATECMSVFMFIIRQWEEALDDCERGCVNCNTDSTHSWDEGVCFYTGSIEGEDGADEGRLLHQLADDLCRRYKTCGVMGKESSGTAKLNYDLFGLFSLGNFQILTGNCPAARGTTQEMIGKMYVPLVQGALACAHQVGREGGGEEHGAEGAAFAAAVLPRVHAVSPEAASVIYENLKVGAPSTDVIAVKEAFVSVFPDIGISCADVGGLWNNATGEYYEGMEPCIDETTKQPKDHTLAIVLGSTFGTLFIAAAAMVGYMHRREKAGKPVFNPLTRELQPNEMSADILALFQRKETAATAADNGERRDSNNSDSNNSKETTATTVDNSERRGP